jgi:hypothetical protein
MKEISKLVRINSEDVKLSLGIYRDINYYFYPYSLV